MKQSFNVQEYAKIRDEAKKHFLAKKTGEQDLFSQQSKLYKPIIQSTKDLEKNLISGQHELMEQIVPELIRKKLPQLEFERFLEPIVGHEATSSSPVTKTINLDGELLNETHRENLQDMSLELPSEVFERNSMDESLRKISKMNRILGQYLGKSSIKTEKEKEMYRSQKDTLQIYEKKINGLKEAKQFEVVSGEGVKRKKLVKLKRGRGRPKKNPDVIYYRKQDELIEKLSEYCAAKQAGNTGVDNYINSILDELLEIKAISKDDYAKIFRNIFD